MNILIKQATIVDSNSSHNGKVVDILIEKGVITQIKKVLHPKKALKQLKGIIYMCLPVG